MANIIDSFRLSGKIAVVTGGSGLYGRQMVLALAEAGAVVYTVSRRLESNEEYAFKMRAQGLEVYADTLDQSDEKSVHTFLKKIEAEGKKIDILVNNAVHRPFKSYDDDVSKFEESMHINATGLFIISRIFGNHMAENGGGSIINIGSYMGLLGPDYSLYEGTDMEGSGGQTADYFFHKGGMENYTRFLASYYGSKKVRCNVLHLGGFYSGQNEEFVQRYSKKTFLNRMANETDIKGAVVFLASSASEYMTGASIVLDGGYSAK